MFTHPNAVYAKLFFNQHHTRHQYHQHGHTYIGSTSITIPKREYNRHAKLKQLHNNHPISAELSLRYWHSKNNLHHYSTIYLSHHDTYDQAWTYEHLRIQEWQPTLNWPYIQRHLKLKASGWQFSKHRTTFTRMSTHKRLFQRLRRRQHTIKQPHLHTSQRLHALTVLRELSKHTLSSFQTSTAIRSGKYTDLEIYAFRRMAASLEEPDRSRVLHLLHSALSFRNLTPPKANKPFTIPFLSHNTFSSSTEKWLRTLIQHHMHHVIPFHPPTTKLREAAHKTLRSRLYNHKRWEELFSTHPTAADMPCSCHHMHTLLRPNHTPPLYDGHYVLTLEDLQLPSHLELFLQANMNSTFFPTKTQYFQHFEQQLTYWLRHHGLPTALHQHSLPFLHQQWKQHIDNILYTPRFTSRNVTQLQQFLTDKLVLHHADHELQNLRLFCPQHYFHGCLTTWNTPQLFLPLPDLTAQQLHQFLTQSFPASIRKAYPWGFRTKFYTPHGVVFLKQKKSWRKGRTVISYFRSIAGTLLRATSKALDIMLLHLLPQHPGQLSIPNLWQHLHNHFQTTPEDIHLTPINDDLVGFFNSVPQQRLVDAVISLCNRWKAQHNTTTITIDVQSTGNPIQHSHIGRHYIHHPQQRTLDTQHIPLIVQQALHSCIFQACNTYYKQIQGAGIGSQLSPALCNVAITLIEHTWQTTYHNFLHQPSLHLLNTRYVDNRYILLNEQYRSALPITTLAHPEFYEQPVEIEPVDDDHLLGFLIDPLNRTVTFQLPTHSWQIRDPQSAGSHRLRLSGLQSRHHTLQKYTYPKHLAHTTAQKLMQLYMAKGHSPAHCAAALRPRGKRLCAGTFADCCDMYFTVLNLSMSSTSTIYYPGLT